jgi:hypothetical protein
MSQLLAHLIGDYILQTDTQAQNKAKSKLYAGIHAFTYTLPFVFITQSIYALLVISCTHFLIDHYRLAKYLIIVKNLLDNPKEVFAGLYNTPTGYKENSPIWLSTWLFIIADNTMHMTINYIAIKYF